MTPLASHICPKCHAPRIEAAFKRKDGKLAGWCEECRAAYRDRLTRLRDSKKIIKHGIQEMATEIIAKAEGYSGHPLANLLALSHIAGAKRALAIRDGKSWRGKKAWSEYYRAQRELAASSRELADALTAFADAWAQDNREFTTRVAVRWSRLWEMTLGSTPKRDPNSAPVSSKGEENSNG